MILYATKCWGGDYVKYMQDGFFDAKVPPYKFDDKILFLNNGVPDDAEFPCKTYKVSNSTDVVLKFFDLTKDEFKGGFVYSIEELTEIWYASWAGYDYICHYASDCWGGGDWVTQGLKELKGNVKVVSPASKCNTWHDKEGKDQFFSDQAYLIPVRFWAEAIYKGYPDIKEYPSHGGDSFEKKCAQILRATGNYRKILTNHYHEHAE